MRWTDYTDTLEPAARATLLNALTLGCGYVAFAAWMAGRDRAAGVVLGALQAALASLLVVAVQMGWQTAVAGNGRAGPVPHQHVAPLVSWQSWLAQRSAEEVTTLGQQLAAARSAALQLGTGVRMDVEVTAVWTAIDAALSALEQLLAGVERDPPVR